MPSLKASRRIIAAVALFTLVSPFLADGNRTHIFHPGWTPHAKFHGGQTIAFGALTGALALWVLWRRRGGEVEKIRDAAVLASLYWISQALAILTPGSAFFDPEVREHIPVIGGVRPNQLMLDVIILALLWWAWRRARRAAGNRPGQEPV